MATNEPVEEHTHEANKDDNEVAEFNEPSGDEPIGKRDPHEVVAAATAAEAAATTAIVAANEEDVRDEEGVNDEELDEGVEESDDNHVEATNDEDDSANNQPASSEPSHIIYKEDNTLQWILPANKDICTLEEIRRGQIINKTAPNECPVPNCGKKINELKAEPSPGTIASGLRTHVLFVHYARRIIKKRKLNWSAKRRSQPSPRKQFITNQAATRSPSTSEMDFEPEPENCGLSNFVPTGLNLMQKGIASQNRAPSNNPPGSLINRKVKQLAASKCQQQPTSLQSLIEATGGGLTNGGRFGAQAKQNTPDSSAQQKNFNQTTSSLFSILAGLTQQPQQQLQNQRQNLSGQQQSSISRNIKTAHGANTISISQCSRNNINNNISSNINNNNGPVNSSLLSLLNEKISGNVASSLQSQLKKSLDSSQLKVPTPTTTPLSRQSISSPANQSYYHQSNLNNNNNNNNNDSTNYNNGTSILSSLCSSNGDNRLSNFDSSLPLNSFIELIAIKTGSNIGSSGVAEAKKIIEKFTTSLICSSQTIADHYLAPFGGEAPQQKPEISPSDVMLAYKMMHKSYTQP